MTKSSRIARCANRIVQVARGEVENLDDPKFKNEVGTAADNLAERMLYSIHHPFLRRSVFVLVLSRKCDSVEKIIFFLGP